MQHSPNISKIIPPRLPPILHRRRLNEFLEQNREKRLILILGQAAQGKSTLAASYTASTEIPSAWINLGPEDYDPVNFLYLLTLSLQRTLKDIDFSPVLHYPSLVLGPREELSLHREWSQSLFERIPGPVQVILDGLDCLSEQAPSFRLLQIMLEEAPPHLCFIMLSRGIPPLPIQTLKIRQQACVLESEDLAFTLSETKQFFASVRRLTFTAEQVQRIHQLTGGWIGGMVLLSESMERSPQDLKEELLSEDFSKKLQAEVFQYFGENIFAAEASQVKDFLIQSSILDIIEPEFAGNFTGTDNVQEILTDLTNRNLFIQSSFDKKKGWLFKYHQLFRDFLQAKFRAAHGEEQQWALYRRAASLFEERGEWEEAIKYYLKSAAYPEAATALIRIGLDLLKVGRTADISQWIQALPDSLVQESPWLLLYRFMTRRFTGASEDILSLQRAVGLFEEQGDERGLLLSLAYFLEAGSFRGNHNLAICDLAAKAEALLASLTTDHHPYERAVLWFQFGLFTALRGESPRQGFRACQQAFLLAQGLEDLVLQLNASFNAYLSLCLLGQFQEAEEWRQIADQLVRQCDYPELRANYQLFMCKAAFFRGDLATATAMLRLLKETAQRHKLLFLQPHIMNCDLFLDYLQGRYAQAEEVGRAHYDLSCALGVPWAQGMALHIWALCYHHQGDWRKAQELFQRAREVLSTPEGYSFPLLETTKLHLGLIAIHLGEITPDIEKEVQESLDHWSNIPAPLWMADSHFTMAFMRWAQGRKEEARTHLQAALAIARERSLHHFFVTTPRELVQACVLALELEVAEPEREYAGHLLCTHLADLAGPELERLARHPDKGVAERAWKVRRALHRSRTPRLRLQTLGEFRLWRGETLMEEQEWERSQPRLLLKALLAHGPHSVSKDVILEDLWPDAATKTAENNLRVTLHRLRKALEPALDKDFGSSYLHFQGNQLWLNEELWQIDAYAFSSLCQNGRRKEEEGNADAALALYQEAIKLYDGDFLAEDAYLSWATSRRQELRRTYLNTLFRLAELLEARGSLSRAVQCLQKVVQADPALEAACQRLMLLYAHQGKHNAALRLYADCRRALKEELSTEPDAVTTAIYHKILESQNRS